MSKPKPLNMDFMGGDDDEPRYGHYQPNQSHGHAPPPKPGLTREDVFYAVFWAILAAVGVLFIAYIALMFALGVGIGIMLHGH